MELNLKAQNFNVPGYLVNELISTLDPNSSESFTIFYFVHMRINEKVRHQAESVDVIFPSRLFVCRVQFLFMQLAASCLVSRVPPE